MPKYARLFRKMPVNASGMDFTHKYRHFPNPGLEDCGLNSCRLWPLVSQNISQTKTFTLNCSMGFGKRDPARHLIMLVEELAKNMQFGKLTDLILLDFSKAFDKVAHEKLLLKLHLNCIRGNTLNWIKDFLEDLKWTNHINDISRKANQTLGFLKRNIWVHNRDLTSTAYKTLVRPQLEYASTVWSLTQAKILTNLSLYNKPLDG